MTNEYKSISEYREYLSTRTRTQLQDIISNIDQEKYLDKYEAAKEALSIMTPLDEQIRIVLSEELISTITKQFTQNRNKVKEKLFPPVIYISKSSREDTIKELFSLDYKGKTPFFIHIFNFEHVIKVKKNGKLFDVFSAVNSIGLYATYPILRCSVESFDKYTIIIGHYKLPVFITLNVTLVFGFMFFLSLIDGAEIRDSLGFIFFFLIIITLYFASYGSFMKKKIHKALKTKFFRLVK